MQVIRLTRSDVLHLAEAITRADAEGREVRVAVDSGFKFKIGGEMWTPPLGVRE